jgi:hypothetical protein
MVVVSVVLIVCFLLSFVYSGGFLAAAGQPRDVAGKDAGRDEVHGDLPSGAVRLVSRVVVAIARLRSGGMSGRHTIGVIAGLRGGRDAVAALADRDANPCRPRLDLRNRPGRTPALPAEDCCRAAPLARPVSGTGTAPLPVRENRGS